MIKERFRNHTAKGLLIHEISPASDSLSNQQIRHTGIRKPPRVNISFLQEEPAENNGRDNTAMECQTTLPYIEDRNRIGNVLLPFKQAVPNTRTDVSNRQHHDEIIFTETFFITHFFQGTLTQIISNQRTGKTEDCIPSDMQ